MTDLEICKRIAEIERVSVYIDGDDTGNFINLNHPMSDRGSEMYNPLTDKALCFDLMVKYQVTLTYGQQYFMAKILLKKEDGDYSFSSQTYCPQRAICLAVIEAS